MNHKEVQFLLHGYIDGEIDLLKALEIEEHLQSCQECTRVYEDLKSVRSAIREAALYTPAPARLEKQIRSSVRKANKETSPRLNLQPRWAISAAVIALIVLLTASVLYLGSARGQQPAQAQLAQEVESAHVRSMMANHLIDVTSSDQHTVKPWFDGKLDFSPPVVDLAKQGYPLIGGRLDYLDGRPVAALVYRRNKHLINLFIWPTTGGAHAPEEQAPYATTDNGFHIYRWSAGGMNYWAVSDLNIPEMESFVKLVQANFR